MQDETLEAMLERVNRARIERFRLEGRSREDGLTFAERARALRLDRLRAERAALRQAAALKVDRGKR